MPDICMCNDVSCPKRANCFRYLAKPDPLGQSYFAESPRPPRGQCCYQWVPTRACREIGRTVEQADADNDDTQAELF